MFKSAPFNLQDSTKWFRDAIVYQILVDRFAGYNKEADPAKPDFLGGNIRGIIEKLPYLEDLGINTLWITPVFKTTAYHGYHITDFYTVDERFGSNNELKHLIGEAHKRNIRVILDFVANHCSVNHPYFLEAQNDRKSKYRRWFYFNPSNNDYLCFLQVHELPKINLDFNDARMHIIEAAKQWISMGADGFRLDHAVGPSHDFWKAFKKEIKALDPGAVLIGEAWLEGVNWDMLKTIHITHKYLKWTLGFKPEEIQREYTGELDGVLDFYFRFRISEYIAWKDKPEAFRNEMISRMKRHYSRFPANYYLPSFIDNHDMNRFLLDAGQNLDKLKAALAFQFSLPQPPILYYGTETGLSQQDPIKGDEPYSDLKVRQPMPWENLNMEMIGFCRDLITKRKAGNSKPA